MNDDEFRVLARLYRDGPTNHALVRTLNVAGVGVLVRARQEGWIQRTALYDRAITHKGARLVTKHRRWSSFFRRNRRDQGAYVILPEET